MRYGNSQNIVSELMKIFILVCIFVPVDVTSASTLPPYCEVALKMTADDLQKYKNAENYFINTEIRRPRDLFSKRILADLSDPMTWHHFSDHVLINAANENILAVEMIHNEESEEQARARDREQTRQLEQQTQLEAAKSPISIFSLPLIRIAKKALDYARTRHHYTPVQHTTSYTLVAYVGRGNITKTIPLKNFSLADLQDNTSKQEPHITPQVSRISNSGRLAVVYRKSNHYNNGIIYKPGEVYVALTESRKVRTFVLDDAKTEVIQTAFSPSESKLALFTYDSSMYPKSRVRMIVLNLESTNLQVLQDIYLPFANLKGRDTALTEVMSPKAQFISENSILFASDNFRFSPVNLTTGQIEQNKIDVLQSGLVQFASSEQSTMRLYKSHLNSEMIWPADLAVTHDFRFVRVLLGRQFVYAEDQVRGRDPANVVSIELIYKIETDGTLTLSRENFIASVETARN